MGVGGWHRWVLVGVVGCGLMWVSVYVAGYKSGLVGGCACGCVCVGIGGCG